MSVNTSERRIERAMVDALTGRSVLASSKPGATGVKSPGSGGWVVGRVDDYDRALMLDPVQLTAFLEKTQFTTDAERDALNLGTGSPTRQAFLSLLREQITQRGVIDVLRRGVAFGELHVDLFYGMRSHGNPPSPRRFTQNRFSLIPHLPYSEEETRPAVDLCLFVNGLPIATFALTDGLNRRSVDDAIEHYRAIQVSHEPLFQPGRCMAHFAVDEQRAYVSSELKGDLSNFLTFNQGSSEADGNPANLFGIATDYLWRRILTRPGVIDIIENYAQMMTTADDRSVPIFPRYHQLEVVRRLLADAEANSVGHHYLLQHSAGSGTSFSIAWLTSQLIGLQQDGVRIFDSTFVLSDRRSVERRLGDAIRNFSKLSARISPEPDAPAHIRECIERGVSVILSDVAQYALILDDIGAHPDGRRFAFIVDEAQPTSEDQINRVMIGRAPLRNTSTFVFAPTANHTTLGLFGQPFNELGTTKYRPFHAYSTERRS
ncbi:MAG: hypothetical protein ACKVVP_13250 [Chloroflexota bacterium]